MTIGDKIRKVRELKSYRQEYVAGRLGMSVTAYGNIERGESRLSFERLEQIARVLEVTVPELLTLPDTLLRPPAPAPQEPERYPSVLRAYEQLVHSLESDIAYLRRQNEQLLEALTRQGTNPGGSSPGLRPITNTQ